MIDILIPFLVASVLLTISPGPDIIYVLVQSIANGKNAGLATALGLVSGIAVHTSLVAFGISAIIKESEILFLLIKIFGALYLVFLAFKIFKSEPAIQLDPQLSSKNKPWALYRQGIVMNILNPKVTIFFLAFFPGFLWDPLQNTVYQFYVLGFLFMLQALLIFGMVAILAGKIASFLKAHQSSTLILKWVQVLVFIGIAVFILI